MSYDKNKKVLVVDDFSTMRHIIKTILCLLGFSTITVAEVGDNAPDLLVI